MGLIETGLRAISRLNDILLRIGRSAAWVCVVVMVAAILLQVFYRYVLNAPLAWTEEAARVMMIWMMAFAAPSAFRWGGFVSIDMLKDALPTLLRRLLMLFLLIACLIVLMKLFELALAFFQRGFRTSMASIWYPLIGTGEDGSFGLQGWRKVKRAWVYLAMPVCFGAMLLVNIELLLREIGRAIAGDAAFPEPPRPIVVEAE